MTALLALALSIAFAVPAAAQRPEPQLDSAGILHEMHELEVLGSVLYVAAHPDDENTRLISYLSKGRQVRTAYLSLTRGDGGQNLIGPELGDALGILRTQELLEARRVGGGEQFFTRAVDFGYSKNPEESFAKWGRQEVLGDVVRVVRRFRPDVIITRFDTDGSGGHGHHTASALLAREAFDLAADPKAFPEQIAEGLEPWQAKRLFFNASTWWRADLAEFVKKEPSGWVTVDVGGFDPLLGMSYTELAGRSRSQHKSQGFGAAETRGESTEYLRLDKGEKLSTPDLRGENGEKLSTPDARVGSGEKRATPDSRVKNGEKLSTPGLRVENGEKLSTPDLFDGVELGWARVGPGGDRVGALVRDLVDTYDLRAPEKSLPRLSALARALDEITAAMGAKGAGGGGPGRDWVEHQADIVRRLILQVCGAVVEVTSNAPRVAAGDTLKLSFSSMQRRPGPPLELLHFDGNGSTQGPVGAALAGNHPSTKDVGAGSAQFAMGATLPWNHPTTKDVDYAVAGAQAIDQPYWLAAPHAALYRTEGTGYSGIEPASRASASFRGTLRLADGLEFRVERAVIQRWVDRVAGECTRQVAVTPVASIEITDGVAVVTGERAVVSAEVLALTDDLGGALSATTPDGWSIEKAPPPVEHLRRGERRRLEFALRRAPAAQAGLLHFSFAGAKGNSDRTLHVIDYPHILPQTWYTPADVRLVPMDVAVNVRTVGYIDGAGDDVPKALTRLGIAVQRIDPASAHAADLEKCDAVVTGIRAYNTVKALSQFQPALLAYVESGGTLLVQYNTNGSDLVLDPRALGPYPFTLTRDRVTVEEAPATFLVPSHPLMTTPNRLGPADFAGWIQERGLYFAGDLDPKYTPLIAWNDPGEKPTTGALIACDFGKGRFIYTGISLFRQLPAGVPGAYRLLANLLARRTSKE